MNHEGSATKLAMLASVTAFAGSMAILHLAGGGALAAPPLTSAPALSAWVADHEPTVIAVVLMRMLALGLGYHLALTTLLAVVGRAIRAPRLVSFADAITLPVFRSTAGRLAGLLISASTLAGGALPSAAAPAPDATAIGSPMTSGDGAVIQRVRLSAAPIAGSSADDVGAGTATVRLLPTAPVREAVPIAAPAPTLHRVVPGDHLWGVAEEALESAWGRPVADDEVDPFWRQVIAANPDIADPDLIFPGQVLVVPPTPPPAS